MPISVEDLNLPLRGAPGWDVPIKAAIVELVDSVNAQETATNDAIEVISGAVDANDATIAAAVDGGAATPVALEKLFVPARAVFGAGIDPTGVADSTAAIQAILNAAADNSTVRFPAGSYKLTAALTISKPLTIDGAGATITQTGTAVPLFEVAANNVRIQNLTLVGRQSATYSVNEVGVRSVGTLASPRTGLRVEKVALSTFAGGAISVDFTNDFKIRDCSVSTCAYFGIVMYSSLRGEISRCSVAGVSTGGQPNAYGITNTKRDGDLATFPRSADITISDCAVSGVPDWAGIDSHGGERITIQRCTVTGCKRPIDMVAAATSGGTNTFAPLDVKILDNTVDGSGISTTIGIGVSGATGTPGSFTELATGIVSGNHVIRCGDPTSNLLGGFWFRGTQGLRVIGNQATEPGSHGVVFISDNYAFSVVDLIAVDPWSDTHTIPSVLTTRSTHNTGVVAGMIGRRGTKTAANVLAFGIYQSDPASTSTVDMAGANYVDTGALVAEASSGLRTRTQMNASQITVGRNNGRLGFFGTTPIARQALAAAATDAATTQTLVNDIRSKLIALGLTT